MFLQAGTTFVVPTGCWYEPTEGAVTDPYPAVPADCANANVLVSVKAVASAIVVSFMIFSFSHRLRGNRTVTIKIFFKRNRSRQAVHINATKRRMNLQSFGLYFYRSIGIVLPIAPGNQCDCDHFRVHRNLEPIIGPLWGLT